MKACRSAQLVALGVLAAALALFAAPAFADGTGAPKKKSADSGDKGDSASTDAVADGATKYAARDFPGAIAAFQKVIEADPKNPIGYYFLGEAQLAANNMTEAEAAWNRASLEASDKNASLRAKVLFVLADLKERQKKWDEARTAWQVYADWVAKAPSSGFAGSANARQHAIDIMQTQDKQYVVVRQRIADTKAGNVFSDVSKPSPPPATVPSSSPPAPAPASGH